MNTIRILLPTILLLYATNPILAAESDDFTLNIAYSARIFEDANMADVRATTKVLIDTIGARNPHFRGGEVQIFQTLPEWRTAAEAGVLTLCILSITDYLELEPDGFLEPLFLYEDGSGIGEELLVLVHKKSGVESIDQISGLNLRIPQNRFAPIARMWLDSLNVKPARIEEKGKGGKAILSTFFLHQTACVVTRGTYEAMKELNPQIGRDMMILARSPNYISDIICMSRPCNPNARAFILETLPILQDDDATDQIMVAYGIDRFAPFVSSYLESMRDLVAQQKRLMAQTRALNTDDKMK
jgi:phosphonate transport system substrate-binding protein